METTCRERFRCKSNCNQWLMEYWQLAEGISVPRPTKIGSCYHIKKTNFNDACSAVTTGKHRLICINDTNKHG